MSARFGRHLWRTREYVSEWGVVPCQCSDESRAKQIAREIIPRALFWVLWCFLYDRDSAVPDRTPG